MQPKTLLRGLSKTRKGKMPINIQTLIHGAKTAGFLDTVKSAVSEEEAHDALKALNQHGRAQRYAEGAAIGGVAAPALHAVGRVVEAVVGAPKGMGSWRAGLARAALKDVTRGQTARHVAEGALGGGVIQAVREGVELGKAKKTVREFVEQHRRQPHTEE